ncbi:TetR family transcriptional regulator [Microbacterium karelineae]|uniref:TetR/AcrR family transcriptional regulator n=1 Tax=Microbacterium karelineae TaxID=2654283 RepID=UPI0012EB03AC|nr:TetR family transcriptional regulator [Microbacterium karelineae]
MTSEARRFRGRGRPRAGESDGRERILEAAAHEFAEHGYDGATTRAIAARAGVDPAAIHHHFGKKADLFAEVIGAPMRPDRALPAILDGPIDGVGERLVRYILTALEDPTTRTRAVTLLRSGVGKRAMTPMLASFLEREVIRRIAVRVGGDDAELRASLVGSQIGGMVLARYVLKFPALADAPIDEVARRVGAAIQTYLAG